MQTKENKCNTFPSAFWKPNTPLSKISTTQKSSNLFYESIRNHSSRQIPSSILDTVPVEDYLDDNWWVTGECSDILIEEAEAKAQVDAGRRYNGEKNKSASRFVLHQKLTNPITRIEWALELKLAQKVSKRLKQVLRGLWDTLAPRSTVVRTSPTSTLIKEPGAPEVKVRNSDIAKISTKTERNTDLRQYAQRRPLPCDKTTEVKIAQQTKELNKKYRGDINTRHRQADKTSGISLANSNISKAISYRKHQSPKPQQVAAENCLRHTISRLQSQHQTQQPRKAKEIAEHQIMTDLRAQYALSATRNRFLSPSERELLILSSRTLYRKKLRNYH